MSPYILLEEHIIVIFASLYPQFSSGQVALYDSNCLPLEVQALNK